MFDHFRRGACTAAALGLLLFFSGCNQKTPEERLTRAEEALEARDSLTAEIEARKVIEKAPDDPAAIQAHMLLGRIYLQDRRVDEALAEYDAVLDKVPQSDGTGKQVLAYYLQILQQQGRYDDALKKIELFQKENASDRNTSLGLEVAKIPILTTRGETTAARSIITYAASQTSSTQELGYYRELLVTTFMEEGNTTEAITVYQRELDKTTTDTLRRELIGRMAWRAAQAGEYDTARKYAEEVTSLFDKAIAEEVDPNLRAELAYQLAMYYLQYGNLNGADAIFQRIFRMNVPPQLAWGVIDNRLKVLLRQGRTTETMSFAREGASRFPEAGLQQLVANIEKETSGVESKLPRDTSTLVLMFEGDPLLAPKTLAMLETTSTAVQSAGTTETAAPEHQDKETTKAGEK